ncbi:MAG: hypothetical protein OHK0048_21160 [Rhodoferax sp.]
MNPSVHNAKTAPPRKGWGIQWMLITTLVLPLAACDLLGLGPDPRVLQKAADAKAIGAACRYGLRSLEDCYTLNKGVSRSNIYAGWREMDEYMRENKIEGIRAEIPIPPPAPPAEETVEPQTPKAKAH